MTRGHLKTLDERSAFQTSPRFDLLANDHVAFPSLGAPNVEDALRASIGAMEGVISVVGRIGSGKSSLIANVLASLDERFIPLRVTMIGADAQDPTAFARRALREIGRIPDTNFDLHERQALRRASAETHIEVSSREHTVGARLRGGKMVTAEVVADVKKITSDSFEHTGDTAAPLAGLDDVFQTLWAAGRCPVLVVNDTDHWDAKPDVAEGFFDQTARALSQKDAVTVVAAQTEYTRLPGYRAVRAMLRHIDLPALTEPEIGISKILQHRVDRERISCRVDEILEPEALRLLAEAYTESTDKDRGGDLRRTIAAMRDALEIALDDPTCEKVAAGHVQEALSRNPLTKSRVFTIRRTAS